MINMENKLMLEYKNLEIDTQPKKRKRIYKDNVLLEERVRPFDGYSMNFEQVWRRIDASEWGKDNNMIIVKRN